MDRIPTNLLLAELSRRNGGDSASSTAADDSPKPKCGSGKTGSYDTMLHVLALILILSLSTGACAFPLISRHRSGRSSRSSRRQAKVLFVCQHFGTGVLIATAFVHLLPTAFVSLTDPCLPDLFSQDFTPMAGLVAMIAALAVVALEQVLSVRGARHTHAANFQEEWEDEETMPDDDDGLLPDARDGLAAKRSRRPADIALGDLETHGLIMGQSPLPSTAGLTPMHNPAAGTPTILVSRKRDDDGNGDDDDDDNDDDSDSDLALTPNEMGPVSHPHPHSHSHPHPRRPEPASAALPDSHDPHVQRRLLIQCLLLEGGILCHSVFIGMAISVAQGSTFAVFLIAISFHQTFEGLALGSRIAAIHFPPGSLRPWLMVLAFGCTTPFGQAIGLVVHNMYDPMSAVGLLVVGFMNAISSGLLLFAGLVQLLAEDFLTEKSYETLKGKQRKHAYLAVLGGAFLMAAVGAFA